VITAVAGEPIRNPRELIEKIHAKAPGTSVQLAMIRQGKEESLNVSLGRLLGQPRTRLGIR